MSSRGCTSFALLLVAPALLTPAAGCKSVESSAAPVGREFRAYPESHRVDVYVSPSSEAQLLEGFGLTYAPGDLPQKAVMVGRIDVIARGDTSGRGGWKPAAEETRRRARELGADAVVIDDYARSIGRDSANWSDHQYRSLAARAYRYATPRADPGYDPREADRDLSP